VTHLLVDTSVLIKWFHSEGEDEISAAKAILAAHLSRELTAHVLDLALYELGNVLTRALGWHATGVADQLEDLQVLVGPSLNLTANGFRAAAELAETHSLTFYDASWAAAAAELSCSLVTADRQLLATGLAESASQACTRLRLAY
jgi:predicted nucleic acid-binding protein